MGKVFTFPNPVDEVSARLVAGGVVLGAVVILAFDQTWLVGPMALGFLARVLSGPTLSPLGRFVTQVLRPALPFREKLVPGPPKRFAQGIGAVVTGAAAVAHFGLGATGAAHVLVGVILLAAGLESIAGLCLGCKAFALLMRAGVIPPEVCEACNDLRLRRPVAS